jgi:dihydrofolate synthase/folylpolyglutamate synthase
MSDRLLPFDAPLERLKALHPQRIDLTLERMLRVCEALGNPQDSLPEVIHVAGTNGKGSTIAFLRAMAEAQGLRVHVYTSPHLVHFSERIRLGGTLISDEYLSHVLSDVEEANAGEPLTFFEATTAAAFLAFSETPADLLILETGLGGILDATNIVAQPRLSLITPIDYDHQAFLGHDLSTIAKQKAGIIKPGVDVISAHQADEARSVLVREAMKMGSELIIIGEDAHAMSENGRLIFQDDDTLLDLSLPRLAGAHQIANAALAIKAALELGFESEAIDQGLRTASWPGRQQRLRAGPLAAALKDKNSEIWLDGGHNPHAARALRAFIDEITARDPKPLHVICGLLDNKDSGAFFQAFEGLEVRITCVPFSADTATAPEVLAEAAKDKGLMATTATSPLEAMHALPSGRVRVLICGSLYLVGDILALSPDTWPT